MDPDCQEGAKRLLGAESRWKAQSAAAKCPGNFVPEMALVKALRDRIALSRNRHSAAAEHYKHLYMMLAVPSVVMAAAIGVIEVVVPGQGMWRKTTVTLVSAMNTCLLTIANMYGFQSVKDQHFQAAKLYSALLNEFDYTIWFPAQQDPESIEPTVKAYLSKVEKKTSELAGQTPPVPIFILQQVKLTEDAQTVVDPNLERLWNLLNFTPALASASLGVWECARGGVQQSHAHAAALFAFAFQNVFWMEVMGGPNGYCTDQGAGWGTNLAAAFMKFLGPRGVVAAAMMTWSCSRLIDGDLSQIVYVVPQALTLLIGFQRHSPGRPHGGGEAEGEGEAEGRAAALRRSSTYQLLPTKGGPEIV